MMYATHKMKPKKSDCKTWYCYKFIVCIDRSAIFIPESCASRYRHVSCWCFRYRESNCKSNVSCGVQARQASVQKNQATGTRIPGYAVIGFFRAGKSGEPAADEAVLCRASASVGLARFFTTRVTPPISYQICTPSSFFGRAAGGGGVASFS